jgi:hypothetical protein
MRLAVFRNMAPRNLVDKYQAAASISTLKTIGSSETSVDVCQSIGRHISQGLKLNINPKSLPAT